MTESPFVEVTRAYVRGNGGFYPFTAREYDGLREAFMGGKTFFTGETIDGDTMTIKLGEVEAVMFCTVASQDAAIERRKAEDRANKQGEFE